MRRCETYTGRPLSRSRSLQRVQSNGVAARKSDRSGLTDPLTTYCTGCTADAGRHDPSRDCSARSLLPSAEKAVLHSLCEPVLDWASSSSTRRKAHSVAWITGCQKDRAWAAIYNRLERVAPGNGHRAMPSRIATYRRRYYFGVQCQDERNEAVPGSELLGMAHSRQSSPASNVSRSTCGQGAPDAAKSGSQEERGCCCPGPFWQTGLEQAANPVFGEVVWSRKGGEHRDPNIGRPRDL